MTDSLCHTKNCQLKTKFTMKSFYGGLILATIEEKIDE